LWAKYEAEQLLRDTERSNGRITDNVRAAPPLVAPLITAIGHGLGASGDAAEGDVLMDMRPVPPPDERDMMPQRHRFLEEERFLHPRVSAAASGVRDTTYNARSYKSNDRTSHGWGDFSRPVPATKRDDLFRQSRTLSPKSRPPCSTDVYLDNGRLQHPRAKDYLSEASPGRASESNRDTCRDFSYDIGHGYGHEREPRLVSGRLHYGDQVENKKYVADHAPASSSSSSPILRGNHTGTKYRLLEVRMDRNYDACTMKDVEVMRMQIEALIGTRGVRVVGVRRGSVIMEFDIPELPNEKGISLDAITQQQLANALGYNILGARLDKKELPARCGIPTNEELTEDEHRFRTLARAGCRPATASPCRRSGFGSDGGGPYNHVTHPKGFSFLTTASHWAHKEKRRIKERRAEEDERTREAAEGQRRFRANPCPTHVSVPRFNQMLAEEDARRGITRPQKKSSMGEKEEGEYIPFKARPVPWEVNAPLYERMVLEKEIKRHTHHDDTARRIEHRRGPRSARSASPYRAYNDGESGETKAIWRNPGVNRSISSLRSQNQPFDTTLMHVEQGLARLRRSSASPTVGRSKTPTRQTVKEVPDYAAAHEMLRKRIEKSKNENRQLVTKPEPFNFRAPSRGLRARPIGTEPHDDPTADYRWHKQNKFTKTPNYSRPKLDYPLSVVPRTTKKTLEAQHHVASKIQKIRSQEKPPPEPRAMDEDSEMAVRVRSQIRTAWNRRNDDQKKTIKQRVTARQESAAEETRRMKEDFNSRLQSVKRRPLLIERQGLNNVRKKAAQRALLRVKGALENHGVAIDKHFADHELDILEMAQVNKTM